MEPTSRAYREQSDMQYDNTGTGVQGDNPLSNQGGFVYTRDLRGRRWTLRG